MTPTFPTRATSNGKAGSINANALPKLIAGSHWPRLALEFGGTRYYRFQDHTLLWVGPMRMTRYGDPHCLHPVNKDNALPIEPERLLGFPHCVKDGENLAVQGARDPAPGYLVTRTAHQNLDYPPDNIRRYHNPNVLPFVALPLRLMLAAHQQGLPPLLGCKALVFDLAKSNWATLPVLDIDYTGGGCLSHRVFRDWSYGWKPGIIMPHCWVQVWPGQAATGYELQEWRGE